MKSGGEVAALHALVRGRVQGVGYRWFAQITARGLKLKGGVRNLRNGHVEIIAEGPRNILVSFLETLKEGPNGGDVAEVEEAWTVPSGAFENFEIWPTR